MAQRLLFTSFTTWKSEQISNSSDDLLGAMLVAGMVSPDQVVRLLPVDFEESPRRAIAHFNSIQPDGIVCMGMAETRDRLNLERQAVWEEQVMQSRLPLETWLEGLRMTDVSDDAGQFVCNRTYHALLHHVQQRHPEKFALFIHVPVLTEDNRAAILQDIQVIMNRLRDRLPFAQPAPSPLLS